MTMERTENWAAERAVGLQHQRAGDRTGITESHKHSLHVAHTKFIQLDPVDQEEGERADQDRHRAQQHRVR